MLKILFNELGESDCLTTMPAVYIQIVTIGKVNMQYCSLQGWPAVQTGSLRGFDGEVPNTAPALEATMQTGLQEDCL